MLNTKIVSGLITFAVIALLIIAGPAEAFVLDISISDDKPTEGEIVKFDVSAKIEPSDSISNISYFLLEIEKEGSDDIISCKFLPDGTKLTACPNIINITKKSSAPFGYGYSYGYSYGYGFGEGIFSFEISLDTEGLDHGAYRTRFIAEVEGDVIEKEGKKLIISERKEDKNETSEDKKTTLCHVPPGNPANAHTITVGSPAVQAHLAHGDYLGECRENNQSRNSREDEEEQENHDDDSDDNEGANSNDEEEQENHDDDSDDNEEDSHDEDNEEDSHENQGNGNSNNQDNSNNNQNSNNGNSNSNSNAQGNSGNNGNSGNSGDHGNSGNSNAGGNGNGKGKNK